MAAAAEVAATQPSAGQLLAETGQASSTTMPKKPQHLSLAGVATTAGGGLKAPAKYSLTLHNNKYATGSGKNGSTSTLRDNQQQQRQHHLKALRLTRDVGNSSDQATANGDYKRTGLTGLSPASEDVGVHLSRAQQAAAVNGEASTTTTTTTKLTGNASGNGNGIGIGIGNGNANPLANGAMRTQNNRLWYH